MSTRHFRLLLSSSPPSSYDFSGGGGSEREALCIKVFVWRVGGLEEEGEKWATGLIAEEEERERGGGGGCGRDSKRKKEKDPAVNKSRLTKGRGRIEGRDSEENFVVQKNSLESKQGNSL